MKTVLRLGFASAVLFLLLVGVASQIAVADTAGSSPENGLTPTCDYQSLGPGASVWLKVPYVADYRLQFTLDDYGVGGVGFDVYSSPSASEPVGRGAYNSSEAAHDLNWEGRLQEDGFYYVQVTNSNPFGIPYKFCVNQKLPYYSPPYTDPCLAICSRRISGADAPCLGYECIIDGCNCCKGRP